MSLPVTPAYLALCRRHPLRRALQPEDWVCALTPGGDYPEGLAVFHPDRIEVGGPEWAGWVPRLDQLIELLTHGGINFFALLSRPLPSGVNGWVAIASYSEIGLKHRAEGESREEATYRLVMHVRPALLPKAERRG